VYATFAVGPQGALVQLSADSSVASSLDRDGSASEAELVPALAARVAALDDRIRATEVIDEKTLKELRRTIEALSKRDPKFEERVTNKVDVMADRIETVARTISTTSAALAAKDGEIAQLRRELEVGLSRAGSIAAEGVRDSDPAELAEIRGALADLTKLSKQKMPRGLDGRVDELAAKFEVLAQRIDSVSTTVSTTAAGLSGREGDVNALRRAFETHSDRVGAELAELRRGIDPAPVVELQHALKELADETSRQRHGTRQLLGQTETKMDALADRLDSLTTSLTSTASRVSGTEKELSAFRSYFEEAGGRLSALLGEQRQELAALSARAVGLEQAGADASRVVDQHFADTSGKIDGIVQHLASLAASTTSTASKIAGTEDEVSALRAYVEDAGERLTSLVAGHEQSLAALSARATALEQADGDVTHMLAERVSGASARIDDLASRLDPLGAVVASMTERFEAGEVNLETMERRFHDASSRVDALVADLSRALGDLPDQNALAQGLAPRLDELAERTASLTEDVARVETTMLEQLQASGAVSAGLEKRLDEELGTVGDLSGRLDSLTTSLTSTASRVSGTEKELSAFRSYFEDADGRRSAVLGEQRQALAALSARAVALEQARVDATRVLDQHVADTSGKVDDIAQRLESLAASTTSTASKVAGTEDEVSVLRAYVEDAGGRLSSLVAEHEQSLAALTARAAALEQADGGELSEQVESLVAKLDTHKDERAESAGEIARVAAILEVERASWRARLDTLEAGLNATSAAKGSDELEQQVAGLRDAFDAERASAQAQFDAIANALASSPKHTALEQRLDELGHRLEEVEQRGAAVASKVSHASALVPTALRSLEARLDEVAPASRRTEPGQEGWGLHDAEDHDAPAEHADRSEDAAIVRLRSAET
jgi:chromosome segregation ATPase